MLRDESSRAPSSEDAVDSLLREAVDLWEPSGIGALSPFGVKPGDVLLGRFVVERLAGCGGMGVVHRGTDRVTGEEVAIKVLARLGRSQANRFVQTQTPSPGRLNLPTAARSTSKS
jgi:hypothetical protein